MFFNLTKKSTNNLNHEYTFFPIMLFPAIYFVIFYLLLSYI